MVNKLELNNELISLRKQFAKAKSRTINKLTRKLKAIEHGKTKDPNNKKLDGKASKLVEELKLLKDATKLNIVKDAYIFNQDPDKALKLQKATPEQRAICRLLMNPFLKDAIAQSKKKLDIKDDDEEWKKMLFETGKNKQKKLKKEKFEAIDAAKANAATPGTPLEKKIAAKIAKNKEKKAAKKELKLDGKSKAIDKPKDQQKPLNKKPQATKKPVGEPKKVTLFPVEEKPKESQNDKKEKWGRDNNSFRKNAPAPAPKFQRPERTEKPAEKLHPSWEAKKQKKPAISEFKGKKITFE